MSDLLDRGAAVTPPPPDRRSVLRRVVSGLFTTALIVGVVFLWPARLGGVTRLVIVNGDSMQPTYDFGDLVVSRDAGEAEVGDAVVFAVPDGPAEGLLVIHRVLSIDTDGTITTQGDNRDTPDQWPLGQQDVVGEPVAHIPKAGLLVWMVRSPFVLACIAVLVAALLMWPRGVIDDADDADDDDENDELDDEDDRTADELVDAPQRIVEYELWRLEAPPAVTSVATPLIVDRDDQRRRLRRIGDVQGDWQPLAEPLLDLGAPIDPFVMAEAEAWVDEQLALAASR